MEPRNHASSRSPDKSHEVEPNITTLFSLNVLSHDILAKFTEHIIIMAQHLPFIDWTFPITVKFEDVGMLVLDKAHIVVVDLLVRIAWHGAIAPYRSFVVYRFKACGGF